MEAKWALGLTIVAAAAVGLQASPIRWEPAEGGNGHWYELVETASGPSWSTAEALAESRSHLGNSGCLATITSEQENTFIADNLLASASGRPYWLGGYQPSGPEPAGGWLWITGEDWGYENWNLGEPNNSGDEDYLVILAVNVFGTWNDAQHGGSSYIDGYVVEYVPEPAALALLALGGLTLIRRRG